MVVNLLFTVAVSTIDLEQHDARWVEGWEEYDAARARSFIDVIQVMGTLICCGALWAPRWHLPCHITVL